MEHEKFALVVIPSGIDGKRESCCCHDVWYSAIRFDGSAKALVSTDARPEMSVTGLVTHCVLKESAAF